MSDLSAEKVVAELRAVTEEDAYAVPWTTGELCRRAADLIAHQAARLEEWIARSEPWQRRALAAEAALTAAEAEKERLRRTIGHRDRRIARLVAAMNFARSKGVVFPADSEPPVVLSDAALSPAIKPCPHAPTYDAGLCCSHTDDCTFVSRAALSEKEQGG